MENTLPLPLPVRILDFSPYYSPHIGGLEKYAEELHENLARAGCQITVFTPRIPSSAPEEENKPNIKIIRYPAFDIIFNYPLPCVWKSDFWRLWKEINKGEYDVVISTLRFFVQPLFALFLAHRKRIHLIHIEHCSDFVKNRVLISLISRIVDMTIGRFSLKHADAIVTPSQSASHFVKKLSGENSVVIYRGMPFTQIDALSPDASLRQDMGKKILITYVGRLIYGKGVIHLLEALHALKRTNTMLLIIGDGPERSNLEEFVKKNSLSSQVQFLGNTPFNEVISILKVSDIFVNPSYNEGLPTSILEAGVCRRAILATDVGGTLEILTADRSGIIIKPGSTEEVKNGLIELLDDPEKRSRLGENARLEIEEKFNWDITVRAYLKEIDRLRKKI